MQQPILRPSTGWKQRMWGQQGHREALRDGAGSMEAILSLTGRIRLRDGGDVDSSQQYLHFLLWRRRRYFFKIQTKLPSLSQCSQLIYRKIWRPICVFFFFFYRIVDKIVDFTCLKNTTNPLLKWPQWSVSTQNMKIKRLRLLLYNYVFVLLCGRNIFCPCLTFSLTLWLCDVW